LVGRYNVRRWERRTRQNSSKKQPWLQRQRETELWDSFSSALSRRHLALLAAPYPTHDAVTFKGPAVRFQWSARPGLCSRLLQRTTTAAAAATFSSPAQNGEAHWQSFKAKRDPSVSDVIFYFRIDFSPKKLVLSLSALCIVLPFFRPFHSASASATAV
jgi:hypothetical protein